MVDYELDEQGYGVITINRPKKRNAISKQMIQALDTYVEQAKIDRVTFLIITSAGEEMFCAGGDLTYLHGNLSPIEAFQRLDPMKQVNYKIATFPVPVICLLNGDAIGGGCEIATACDIRIAKEGTSFGFVQSNLGILPGWGGGTLLYEKVNPDFALQWLLEGFMLKAERLREIGWIHHVIPQDLFCVRDKLLKSYLNKSYKQMLLLKEQYNKKMKRNDLLEKMTQEVKNTANIWGSVEHKMVVEKFLSRK
ncbi:enoyl-CoA hydratase/isomerase family protein [Oceanobacillus bengalensis]|uniref:Enoyl-CoA hydratase/isomerase family protein n=1 Tax=Oceanobacillus bengalensis TaxID=1435466 RepID=A0A494Z1K0_9BACI|nr:enoyl-CoA hydratase/isomerase family protein [Oceanobacillus bengalensis]RKQ16318.1 enoyl-CoA hydratase/isomerase family protein [Oceanobacillus bengalensis]